MIENVKKTVKTNHDFVDNNAKAKKYIAKVTKKKYKKDRESIIEVFQRIKSENNKLYYH